MYSPHKHSYLQNRSSGIPPRIINRAVHAANSKHAIDSYDLDPPFNRLTSEQPMIPISNVDVTRRPTAFGSLAVPLLMRDLHDKDEDVIKQAINSLGDLVHDPEKAYQAIKVRVTDRMADLLEDEDPSIRERVCMALTTIAETMDGKEAIVRNKRMMNNFIQLLDDPEDAVRVKVCACLEMISRTWVQADVLVEYRFIELVLERILGEEPAIIDAQLELLTNLMYCDGKDIALENNAFDIFVELLLHDCASIEYKSAKNLTLLTSTKLGKKKAEDTDIMERMNTLLMHVDPDVYTYALSTLMYCTIKPKPKLRAKDIPNLLDRLVAHCKDWAHPSAQMFAMKALGNICEVPEARKYVRCNYLEELKAIQICSDPVLEDVKAGMLKIVGWDPSLY